MVSAKSPGTVPLVAMLVMVRAAAPVFCSLAVCAELVVFTGTLLNVRLDGVNVTTGVVPAVPVPESETVCGLPAALSEMLRLAPCAPVAVGANFTEIVQLNCGTSADGQLLVCGKAVAFAPVTLIPLMVRLASPEFVRLMFCAALVLPTGWLAKVSEPGVTVAWGAAAATPVPDKLIVRGLPGSVSVITILPVRRPVAVGLKVTLILQLANGPPVPLQPLFIAKSAPVSTTLFKVTEVLPWL